MVLVKINIVNIDIFASFTSSIKQFHHLRVTPQQHKIGAGFIKYCASKSKENRWTKFISEKVKKNHLFRFCNKTAFLLQKLGLEAFGGILFLLVLPLILEHFNLVRRTEFVRTVSRHIAYGRRILKIWIIKKVVKFNKKTDTRNQLV